MKNNWFDKYKQCWICGNKANNKYCSSNCKKLFDNLKIQRLLIEKLPISSNENFTGFRSYVNENS